MSVDTIKHFKCSCNASARFIPLYRFNESGNRPNIAIGVLCPPAIRCVNCRTMYVWRPPSTPKGSDGGWDRQSPLDDLIELENAGG